jgi:hypothetical protein
MNIHSYGLAEMCAARILLRFWIDGEPHEHHGETIGLAPRHFILRSATELLDGMRLTMKFRLATGVGHGHFSELEMFGWVVGVSKLGDGKFGAQVELECD